MQDLLEKLSRLKITLKQSGNDLDIYDPANALTEHLLQQIKENKSTILSMLSNASSGGSAYKSIASAGEKEYYVLSSAQRRMYFLSVLYPGTVTYNIPQVLKVTGTIDAGRLEAALNKLVERHESLRTIFVMVNDDPCQQVLKNATLQLEKYTAVSDAETARIVQSFVRPFDLSQGALIRMGIIHTGGNEHVLIMDMHHIISDGVSGDLLIRDLISLYEGALLPPMSIHYKDYAEWQQSPQEKLRKEGQQSYWLKEFSGELPSLELPLDYPRPTIWDERGSFYYFTIGKEAAAGLRELAASQGASMFMVMLSVYNILLAKLSNQADVVVGTVTAGRNHADLEGLIGMFVNTLVLRNYPEGGKTYKDYLGEVKQRFLQAMQNQEYQYEDLLDVLQVPRDTSRNAMFDVMLSYQQGGEESLELPGIKVEPYPLESAVAKFDLSLNVFEERGTLECCFDYRSCLFKPETIARFGRYFQRIVDTITQDIDCLLLDIDILDEQERTNLFELYGNSAVAYPKDKTVISLFEEQANRTPEAVAVKYGDDTLTYSQLNHLATALGAQLQQKGVKPGTVVALLMHKTADIVAGMLGILKAGGAYMPVDVDYPADRKTYMLENSGTVFMVTTADCSGIPAFTGNIIYYDRQQFLQGNESELQPAGSKPEDLCYVIYTSGTTGNPKGVMIENRNLVRLLFTSGFQFDFGPDDVWTMFHSHCFDFSVWEMYGAILYGGKLVIISKEEARDTGAFLAIIKKEKVSVLNQTPSAFYNLVQEVLTPPVPELALRYVIFGGEALAPGKLKQWKKNFPHTRLINMYGITETTVHVTYKEIGDEEIESNLSNIGKPIPTLSIFLLDQYKKMVPPGTCGELYVGGAGVARGYLNNNALTKLRFIANPFIPGERLYRSGDLARILPSGDLEYLGRIDEQVKIRGFRIELAEIDHHLNKYPAVKEAAVTVKERGGDKFIAAYFVTETTIDKDELKKYLQQFLPEYMLPAFFVQLEKIPLTYNGKLDKKNLPDPDYFGESDFHSPSTTIETELSEIWADILKLPAERIGINRSFFELGGHSLRAVTLRNRIGKQFGIEISVQQIFQNQDIKSQAELITAAHKQTFEPIPRAAVKPYYVLSSAQRRMYFLDVLTPGKITYNIPQAMLINGPLDYQRLESALNRLVVRHESLRTSFVVFNDEPHQVVEQDIQLKLEEYTAGDEEAIKNIVQAFVRPFELSKAPLIRMGVIQCSPDEYVLLTDIHHIVSDGVSGEILIKDLIGFYEGNEPVTPELQYKDYAEWQQSESEQLRIQLQRTYWLSEFEQQVTPLDLPFSNARPDIKEDEGSLYSFSIGKEQITVLKKLAAEQGCSLFMIMLAVYNVFLSKVCNQQDIVVGTPASGRQHPDLDGMIGVFINTLVLRNNVDGEQTFSAFAGLVKAKFLTALQHQEYQYEDLVEALQLPRDMSRNPLFDTMLSYHHAQEVLPPVTDLNISPYPFDAISSKFDLSLDVAEYEDSLDLHFEYSANLFTNAAISALAGYIINIVNCITVNPDSKISNISILSGEEECYQTEILAGSDADYGTGRTLTGMLAEAAEKNAGAIALISDEGEMTYEELYARANQWASYLLSDHAVRAEDRIGICAKRSMELIAVLLGILKSGAAYVFIDPENPAERINWMIQDSGIKLLIASDELAAMDNSLPVSVLDINTKLVSGYPKQDPGVAINEHQLAYIIYTSGSTGIPKGVMIEHASMYDYVNTFKNYFSITAADRVIQQSSFSFDTCVEEIYPTLVTGACLVLVKEGGRDIDGLAGAIEKYKATILSTTPLILNELHKKHFKLQSLRVIISGGDQLKGSDISNFSTIPIYNTYGPAECTVCVTYHRLRHAEDTSTIGKPIANHRIYILSKDKQLVPMGTPGEIAIGGRGLARGYLHETVQQAEKFIANPFRSGERLYLSGDIGKWDQEGNIIFIGRKDEQLKIRGVRVEAGEIESQILQYEGIKSAVVISATHSGNQYLAAYFTAELAAEPVQLKNFLAQRLPYYMIPSYYLQLAEMPVTVQGKLNKSALPLPVFSGVREYEKPANDTETRLQQIWSEVLGLPQKEVGVNDDFFELGGHSLSATTLVNRINTLFNKSVLSLVDIFRHTTIRLLSENIRTQQAQIWESGLRIVSLQYISPEKKNLFFIHDGSGDIQAYVPLAGLIHNRNSWGIRSETMDHTAPVNTGLDELAAGYLAKIRKLQPQGPYSLIGWSTGGAIAYEIVRQLELAGEYADNLILVDTELNAGEERQPDSKKQQQFTAADEAGLLSLLTEMPVQEGETTMSIQEIWDSAITVIQKNKISPVKIAEKIPDGILQLIPGYEKLDSKSLIRCFNTVRTLINASDNYTFNGTVNVPVIFFKTEESAAATAHIRAILGEQVTIIELPGDHFSILRYPEVTAISAIIEQLSTANNL